MLLLYALPFAMCRSRKKGLLEDLLPLLLRLDMVVVVVVVVVPPRQAARPGLSAWSKSKAA